MSEMTDKIHEVQTEHYTEMKRINDNGFLSNRLLTAMNDDLNDKIISIGKVYNGN